MLVHRTKKLIVRSTSVGSDISFLQANRVDPDQAALVELPDLGLLCLQKHLKASILGKGLFDIFVGWKMLIIHPQTVFVEGNTIPFSRCPYVCVCMHLSISNFLCPY